MTMNSRQCRKAKAHIQRHADALVAAPSMISFEGNVRARKWSDALPDARVPHKWSSKAKLSRPQRFGIEMSKAMPDYSHLTGAKTKV